MADELTNSDESIMMDGTGASTTGFQASIANERINQ